MKVKRLTSILSLLTLTVLLIPVGAAASYCDLPPKTTLTVADQRVSLHSPVLGGQRIIIFSFKGIYSDGIGLSATGLNWGAVGCYAQHNGDPIVGDTRFIDPATSAVAIRVILAPSDVGYNQSGFTATLCGSGFGFDDCNLDEGNRAEGGLQTWLSYEWSFSDEGTTWRVYDSPVKWVNTTSISGCLTVLAGTDTSNDRDEELNFVYTYELHTTYRTYDATC